MGGRAHCQPGDPAGASAFLGEDMVGGKHEVIARVEALNFSCLRYIEQELGRFHVLVGPNASGKTTFCDVIRFLGDLVSGGLEHAITRRTENLTDLVWQRRGTRFELAIEVALRDEHCKALQNRIHNRCRYEVSIGADPATEENAILVERVLLTHRSQPAIVQRRFFPEAVAAPESLTLHTRGRKVKTVINKVPGGNDNFYPETGRGRDHVFKLGPRKSALGNLPEDESKFPISTWLKRILMEGVESLVLNSERMRRPSPPGQPKGFRPDGSNLPWVVEDLHRKAPDRLQEWVGHLRTALPDLESVRTVERSDDRHRYLVVEYRGGFSVPAWMVSDGTLRLLALTLPAYLPDLEGVYLIEEPENGVHPRAVETMYQSLSSVYGAQILLATHSPVILSLAEPQDVLCFARTPEGATDIVCGSEHPALRDWKGETNLGVLYAAGVLG